MEFLNNNINTIVCCDVLEGLKQLDDNSIDTIITSPPYNKKGLDKNLKNFSKGKSWNGYQINYDEHDDSMPEHLYQEWQVEILNECYRILKPKGSMFYNHKIRRFKKKLYFPYDFVSKSKFDIYQLIIWNRNSSPNIHKDILYPTTEHIYWLTKDNNLPKVFKKNIPLEFQKEIWNINPAKPNKNHPAPFPEKIPELCILLTTEKNDIILDIFAGTGTTLKETLRLERQGLGFELSKNYVKLMEK